MAVVNHTKREINAKLVFFGPPGCGKGALVRYMHQRIKPSLCGPLKEMQAGNDNLLFFEYTPFEQACLNGYRIRFHLYTLTGPVSNPGTWKMTLKGVDGLLVVAGQADEPAMQEQLRQLEQMLGGCGIELGKVPRLWLAERADLLPPASYDQCFAASRRLLCQRDGSGLLPGIAQLSQELLELVRGMVDRGDDREPLVAEQPQQPAELRLQPCLLSDGTHNQTVRLSLSGETTVKVPVMLQLGEQQVNYRLEISLTLVQESD